MSDRFGTDGIRGVVNESLTSRTAFALGNALCRLYAKPTVFIARDNRVSSDMLMLAIAAGVTVGGGNVLDGGVLPTAACAYLTKRHAADCGVMISASHNPPEFNGIKVFDGAGCKFDEKLERRLEKYFIDRLFAPSLSVGRYEYVHEAGEEYLRHLGGACSRGLEGLHFVLDCANGAASAFAPAAFERLGAKVTACNIKTDGLSVNDNCGALYPEHLSELVARLRADAGFCYDGDADRLIAVDEKGNVVDGDRIICIFADKLKKQGKLTGGLAVGTVHTNTGAEVWLAARGITLARTDIGDKYVAEYMRAHGAAVGGEQSGHVILSEYATTGDGILTSLKLAEFLTDTPLSALSDIRLYPQYNVSVRVKDKVRVLGDEGVSNVVRECANRLNKGRLVVRASGTEPVIRIFAEAENLQDAKGAAERVRRAIAQLKE